MKKILLIMLFVATTLLASMNTVVELEDAYETAEKENKIVMVVLSQKGCPACKYMKDVVFKNKDVVKQFNKDFVAVHLDIHNDYVPLELEHVVTPTIYFLTNDEKIIGAIYGYKNDKDFMQILKKTKAQ